MCPSRRSIGKRVDPNVHRLTNAHVRKLGLLEVRDDVGFGRNGREQCLSGLHEVADLDRPIRNASVGGGVDLRVRQIEAGLSNGGLLLCDDRIRLFSLALQRMELLINARV